MNVKKLDSTKIYWLDKEETVKVKLGGLDMPHGFGSAKYIFRVIYGGAGDIVYMDSNLPKNIHEAVERKPWSFTTPIAMKCTKEQFNGIKYKLVEMGYIFYGITFGEKYRYLSSNFAKDKRYITDLAIRSKYFKECSPIIFESFNPALFLALAAMTNKEDGIKGEWWKSGLTGKLIMQSESSFLHPILRKATAQEIIEHFEKKEFVLQPRWYVELTESNRDIVIPWHENIDKYSGRAYNIGSYYGIFESGAGDAWSSRELASKYQIITTDQFKKYVLKEPTPSCQKTPVVGSIEYIVNLDFDAEKAAEEIFAKIVEFGKSSQPKYEFISESWHINDKKEVVLEDKTIIPIPPTKQATLFDDRVEITDWEPKEGDIIFGVYVSPNGIIYEKYEYFPHMEGLFDTGFIKRTESEAKQLVEKLKQAML